jgi:glutamine cyclotransferase
MLPFLPLMGWSGSWEVGYSFPAPSRQTNGLAFDGRYLWHSNDSEPLLYQINPVGGGVVATTPTFVPDQGDLAYVGGAVWAVSENAHFIYQLDPKSGKTLDSIFINGIPYGPNRRNSRDSVQLEGLTSDGRYLWVDGGTNLIVKVDPLSRKQWMFEMPLEMGYLDGLTWAFEHLWVVTNNATIYEIDPCTMGIIDEFGAPARISGGPEGFAFDGENLWFADNDLDQIYKIILRDKLITYLGPGTGPWAFPFFKTAATQDGTCREGILVT